MAGLRRALLLAASLCPWPAWGQTGDYALQGLLAGRLKSLHGRIDDDEDEQVTLEELFAFARRAELGLAQQAALSSLRELDANKDGVLSFDECSRGLPAVAPLGGSDRHGPRPSLAESFLLADRNADGVLSGDEALALLRPELTTAGLELAARARLAAADADADGRLSDDEAQVPEYFVRLDSDADGYLSLEEYKGWVSGQFLAREAVFELYDQADEDNSGLLTAAELEGSRLDLQGSNAEEYLLAWLGYEGL